MVTNKLVYQNKNPITKYILSTIIISIFTLLGIFLIHEIWFTTNESIIIKLIVVLFISVAPVLIIGNLLRYILNSYVKIYQNEIEILIQPIPSLYLKKKRLSKGEIRDVGWKTNRKGFIQLNLKNGESHELKLNTIWNKNQPYDAINDLLKNT